MKKLMMIAAMMVAALSVNAQDVEVGQIYLKPMVGATLSTFTGDVTGAKMKFGVGGGAEVGFKLAEPFDLTAGVLVMMEGSKAKDNDTNKNQSTTLTYLNVPILANLYLTRGLALKAGVQPGFLLSCKAKGSEFYDGAWHDYEDTDKTFLNKFDLSIPVGLSYEFSNFIIDARYNFGLLKVGKSPAPSIRNGVIMLTLGYKIPF